MTGAPVDGSAADVEAVHRRIRELGAEAGWRRERPSLWPEPRPVLLPHRWRWRQFRAVLERAGGIVSTETAERRNLTLTNPAEGHTYSTVRTIVAAYQMLRSGETARPHRHSPNAVRIVLEGRGAYTVVDGERIPMTPGDVVLTPGGSWHAHGSVGREDCYWLDVLDVPLVHLLEPMFFEPHRGASELRCGSPDRAHLVFGAPEIDARLAAAPEAPDGSCERQIELGTPALPTLSLHVQSLRPGVSTELRRTTASSVFVVTSGRGLTQVEGATFRWEAGDVIAVPAWRAYRHRARAPSRLLRVSDEPTLRALGFLREDAGTHGPG